MEAAIEKEIADLAKPYSSLRSGCGKWASMQSPLKPQSGLQYEIQTLDGDHVGLVYRQEEGTATGYRIDSLKVRLAVKRTRTVFLGIYTIWKLLNPYGLKGISKAIYSDALQVLYERVFNVSEDYPELAYLVAHDVGVDFGECKGLVFADFYHGVFASVDSFTRSKLSSEYVRVLNKLAEVISSTNWLDSKDLHSRIHLTSPLPKSYEQWMRPILHDLHAPLVSPPSHRKLDTVRSVFAVDSSSVSPVKRNLTAPDKVRKPLEVSRIYSKRVELLLEDPKPRKWRAVKPEGLPQFGSSSVPQLKFRIRFKALKHLTLISPLSKVSRRDKKESNLLEDVLQKRSQENLPQLSPFSAKI